MSPRRVGLSTVSAGHYRRHKPDYILALITGLLLIFGTIVMYTISPALEQTAVLHRQLVHIGLALVAFITASLLPLNLWRKLGFPILILGVLGSILLLVPSLALEVNGATRWLNIGSFSFQPAELFKFGLILYLAVWFSERIRTNRLDSMSDTLLPILIVSTIAGVFVAVLQRDLGTMVSILGIVLSMLYLSGIKLSLLIRYMGILFGAGVLATILFPHRLARISTFFDPNSDIDGAGYHINQALIAVGSGGWLGKGLGKSVQVFGYLPEAINDSIFAIIAEQFGFIGSLLVITLYGALAFRLLRIVEKSPNAYMKMLVAGIFGWLVSHVVLNIGSIIGVLPLTGITLPFLSLGGTSLIFISLSFGIAFNVSRYTSLAYEKDDHGGMVSRRGNRWSHRTAYGARGRA